MEFERKDFIFSYGIDFSKEDNLENDHKNNSNIYYVSDKNKRELFRIRNDLFLIAKKNRAKINVYTDWRIPSCYITIEGEKIDFTSSDLKERFINVMQHAKSAILRSINDNILLTVEIHLFAKSACNEKNQKK